MNNYNSIKDIKIKQFAILHDQQPRKWIMGADTEMYISDAWKLWAEDYASAYNELDEDDLEYLRTIECL